MLNLAQIFKRDRITKKEKITFIIYLYCYLALIIFLGLVFRLNHLQFVVLYAAVPAIYITNKLKGYAEKITLEAIFFAVLSVLTFDIVAHTSNSWFVNDLWGIRLFNKIPPSEFVWAFSCTFIMLAGYEYVFDTSKTKKFSKHFKTLMKTGVVIISITMLLNFVFPQALNIPYFYSMLIFTFITITVIGFIKLPKIAGKISLFAAATFLPAIAYELTALELGHWTFARGFHIGYVELFGYTFPFEELLWFPFSFTSFLVIHEVFADNQK